MREIKSGRVEIYLVSLDKLLLELLEFFIASETTLKVAGSSSNLGSLLDSVDSPRGKILLLDCLGFSPADKRLLPGLMAFGIFTVALATSTEEKIDANLMLPRELDKDRLAKTLRQLESERNPAGASSNLPNQVNEVRMGYASGLTPREESVAHFISQGYSNRKICQLLNIHEQSVKNAVSVVLRKLNCDSRVQVALLLRQHFQASGSKTSPNL